MEQQPAIQDGLFLEYRVEGSTGPGRSRAATERLTFRGRPDGRFQVHLEAEEVPTGLYAAAYGDPIRWIANSQPLTANHCSSAVSVPSS